MDSPRQLVSMVLEKTGVVRGLLHHRSTQLPRRLTVLTYHRVFDAPSDYPFDSGVIDSSSAAFDEQLRYLKKHFHVIDTEQLVAFLEEGTPLPPNPVMITFDDGYLDNLEVAAPILQDHGLKAVFFIATSYIQERRLFWWDRISYLIHHREPGRDTIELSYPTRMRLDFANDLSGARNTLLMFMKRRFGLDVERLMDELAAALGVPWSPEREAALANDLVMTWDQVRALHDMGMDIQSHTRTHRPLQTVAYSELVSELAGAKEDLQRELGKTISAISYPVGRSISELGPIQAAVRDAGYKVGFTNATGAQSLIGELDPLDIGRVSMEPLYQGAYFRSMMAIPSLGY